MTEHDIAPVASDDAVTRRELAYNVFGHLRDHLTAAVRLLSELLGTDLAERPTVDVGGRMIGGIECEWAPERQEHLDDRTALDAVVAARTAEGRCLLISVEVKYVDSFSRDPKNEQADIRYDQRCREFGMASEDFAALNGHATRQLLRNELLTESVRRGGSTGQGPFDAAVCVVLARDDDQAARNAVDGVLAQQGAMPTDVRFVGHGRLADAAAVTDGLADWASAFRRRYEGEA